MAPNPGNRKQNCKFTELKPEHVLHLNLYLVAAVVQPSRQLFIVEQFLIPVAYVCSTTMHVTGTWS